MLRSASKSPSQGRARTRVPTLIVAAAVVAASGLGCAALNASQTPSLTGVGTHPGGPPGPSCSAAAAAAGEKLEVQSVLASSGSRDAAPARSSTVSVPSPATAASTATAASPATAGRVATGASGPAASEPAAQSASTEAPTAAQGSGPHLSALSTPETLPSAQTADERRDGLDARLDRELAELDALLRQETELIAKQRSERSGSNAGGPSGGTAAGEANEVSEGEGSEGELPGEAGEQGEGDEQGEHAVKADEEQGGLEDGGGAVGGGGGGTPPTTRPGGPTPRKPGTDCPDDIVAKQIREAATGEKDAELKKKLWKEYEDYKNATCAKRQPQGQPPPPPPPSGAAKKDA